MRLNRLSIDFIEQGKSQKSYTVIYWNDIVMILMIFYDIDEFREQ